MLLQVVVLTCYITTHALCGVEIIQDPLSASNVTVGSAVNFICIINNLYVFPRWNINGYDFTVTNLPIGFQFESDSYSKILTVDPVKKEMNNSVFYCFFHQINHRLESEKATLIIAQCIQPTSLFPTNSREFQRTPTMSYTHLYINYTNTAYDSIPPSTKSASLQATFTATAITLVIMSLFLITGFIICLHKSSRRQLRSKHLLKEEYEEMSGGVTVFSNSHIGKSNSAA